MTYLVIVLCAVAIEIVVAWRERENKAGMR